MGFSGGRREGRWFGGEGRGAAIACWWGGERAMQLRGGVLVGCEIHGDLCVVNVTVAERNVLVKEDGRDCWL